MRNDLYDVFLKAVECGSFSKAGKKLIISSVAVKKQIDNIEKEFNTKLFIRSPKGCTLTENGKIVFNAINDAKKIINECKEKICKQDDGPIIVGYSLRYIDNEFYYDFIKHKDKIRLVELDNGTNYLNRSLSLIDKSIDILLTISTNSLDDKYEQLVLKQIDLVFLVPKSHPLSDKKTLCLRDFSSTTIYKPKQGLYIEADDLFSKIKENNKNCILKDVEGGLYDIYDKCIDENAILSSLSCISGFDNRMKIIPIDFGMKVPFSLIYKKDCGNNVRTFIDSIKDNNES